MAPIHPIYRIPRCRPGRLHQYLGIHFSNSEVSEVLFVSVDFEGLRFRNSTLRSNCQAGFAILDPKDLFASDPSKSADPIVTYNFAVGQDYYCKIANNSFLFGESRRLQQPELEFEIRDFFAHHHNIILIGHDPWCDLRILKHLEVDCSSILGIVDTQYLSRLLFRNPEATFGNNDGLMRIWQDQTSLCDTLLELRCTYAGLHTAGNDAHFTLRAALLLAARSSAGRILTAEQLRRVEILEELRNTPIPNATELRFIQDQDLIDIRKEKVKYFINHNFDQDDAITLDSKYLDKTAITPVFGASDSDWPTLDEYVDDSDVETMTWEDLDLEEKPALRGSFVETKTYSGCRKIYRESVRLQLDWECRRCATMNWARRKQCHGCSSFPSKLRQPHIERTPRRSHNYYGVWYCISCDSPNIDRDLECVKCPTGCKPGADVRLAKVQFRSTIMQELDEDGLLDFLE